jgi:acyl-CoA dehydrogenase
MNELDDLLDAVLNEQRTPPGDPIGGVAWRRLREAGLTSVSMPEALGGAGGDLRDAFKIVTRCGEAGLAVPIVESTLLTTAAYTRLGRHAPDGITTTCFTDALSTTRTTTGWRVSARGSEVAWGESADTVLLIAPRSGAQTVVEVPSACCNFVAGDNLAGEPRARLSIDVELPEHRVHTDADDLASELRVLASLGRSCQAIGAARRATRFAMDYAQSRRQFGRAIGTQQVIAHMIVEMLAESSAGDAAASGAVASLSRRSKHASFDAAAARVQAARTAETVARHAHQIHAAIGIAAEHPLHHLTLRLWTWPYEYGSPRVSAIELSKLALSNDNLWEALAGPTGGYPMERTIG